MPGPKNPPGFVVRTEAQKAAWDNGYRIERGAESGWLHYGSTTAPGSIWIAGASERGPWLLSLDHSGVAAEIGAVPASPEPGPGLATFMLANLSQLHISLDRVYKLALSLPEAPLERFKAKTSNLPRTTEAERLVIQRIGQDVFREALLDYWAGRCPMTGITEPGLLRASHIVPWADCTDAQRLDVHNGLLPMGCRLRPRAYQLCRRRHGLGESPARRDRPDDLGPRRCTAPDRITRGTPGEFGGPPDPQRI
jgi:HNH endonuclease